MTQLEALKDLKAKVEAGGNDYWLYQDAHVALGDKPHRAPCSKALAASRAYRGSLDAALALHEAVLPEWCWSVDRMGQAIVWYPWVEGDALSHECSNDGAGGWTYTPARAWLLAILSALIAQEEQQ
jgi:hypothetical protein